MRQSTFDAPITGAAAWPLAVQAGPSLLRLGMRRRDFTFAGVVAVALPGLGAAQTSDKIHRIGYLGIVARDDPDARRYYDAFFDTLRARGFIEGHNLHVTFRASAGREYRFAEYAAEVVAMKVDVIVTVGSAATLATKRLTSTIPIVMAAVPNPERLGLVASLARPGGNITGLSTMLGDVYAKTLELIREAMPDRRRVAVLANSDNPGSAVTLKGWPARAASMDFVALAADVRSAADLDPALERLAGERAEVLLPHPIMWSFRARILAFAAKHRIAVLFPFREWVPHGALMSYGPDLPDNSRQVALYVVKILNGANPAELPVQQPTKFELVINLKVAHTLGIPVPESVLIRADEVIE
jgi:putative ABC transport system substrate-binding protein